MAYRGRVVMKLTEAIVIVTVALQCFGGIAELTQCWW
jgi:hypothetical protein